MPVKDVYTQFMAMAVTQTAANTLTFSKVALSVSLFEYAGLLITRAEYWPDQFAYAEISTNVDHYELAICGSSGIADLAISKPQVYDKITISDVGTPGQLINDPIVHDWSSQPGGGQLVPAQDIYLGLQTGGFAAAASGSARLWFIVKSLTAQDYFELVQKLQVLRSE